MKFEYTIAKRLQLVSSDTKNKSAAFTLNIATVGISLAIVIMIASIAIVAGFKQTIIHKLTDLQPHIKIANGAPTGNSSISTIDYSEFSRIAEGATAPDISSLSLIFEAPCIFKTNNEFAGLVFRGIQSDYDKAHISECIIDGEFNTEKNNIVISQLIAKKLGLKAGDRPITYFINDEKIKQRRLTVAGIYSSDFDDFDKNIIFGNIEIPRSITGASANEGTAVDIRINDLDNLDQTKQALVAAIYKYLYSTADNSSFQMTTIIEDYSTFFAWLELLDTNIIVILGLMTLVACFSLIAGLLIVVLNRTNMIGILKSMGASNRSIREIFIILAGKLIVKALIYGNAIGFAIILIQKYFRIIKLNPETYYMSFVPIDINMWLLALNIGIAAISIIALIGPSYIITSISPTKTIKFE